MTQAPPPPPSDHSPYQTPPQGDPAQMVKGPAIALLITAGIGIAFAILGIILNLAGVNQPAPGQDMPQWAQATSGTAGVIQGIVALAMGVVIIVGANKMRALESRGFAMAASILAMIPCVSPCCILGLPFGIWAPVVLNKPEVREAFEQQVV